MLLFIHKDKIVDDLSFTTTFVFKHFLQLIPLMIIKLIKQKKNKVTIVNNAHVQLYEIIIV